MAGSLEGEIGTSLKGENGFGYDPIFAVPALGLHLAELNQAEKIKISHRALAFKKLTIALKSSK